MYRFHVVHAMVVMCCGYNWTRINLPDSHVPFYFHNNLDVKSECEKDEACPYKMALKDQKCWGYEENCPIDQRMSMPTCDVHEQNSAREREYLIHRFWKEGDFGYVKGKKDELFTFCTGKTEEDSLLSCTENARYCYAKNLYIDMTNNTLERIRQYGIHYTDNFWQHGEIGGHCKFDKEKFQREDKDTRDLGSWYAEFDHFTSLPFQPITDSHCDVIFNKPVIFMKPDEGSNMYHHFCDFVNLYISQHINNSFSTDVQIIFWILSMNRYWDMFKETFDAFTEYPVDFLYNYHSKRICVREALFPILARASFGLFYSTPLKEQSPIIAEAYLSTFKETPGCYGSSLFKAFPEHLLHRLKIAYEKPNKDKIRITLLDRSANTRNILNQDELVTALSLNDELEVRLVAFKFREMPFLDQIKLSHNSDIFVGMHGAGLTHMLFQPEWGAVVEIYNCEDVKCYLNLARLRGLKYFTLEKSDKIYPQSQDPNIEPKSNNYTVDKDEFMKLVAMAADHVRSHPAFIKERNSNLRDEL